MDPQELPLEPNLPPSASTDPEPGPHPEPSPETAGEPRNTGEPGATAPESPENGSPETPSPRPPREPAESPEAEEPEDAPDAADAPGPEASAEAEGEETTLQTLTRLAEESKAHRLPPAEEERAAALLKEPLSGGRAGISSVMELLAALPWIVSVNAITAIWPEWSPLMRRHLLTGLARLETESALRLRLSLARGLFKVEPPAALKLAAAVAADLRENEETGAFSPRNRQLFANVFIGKGKPWLLQFPLEDLKGAEADALAHAAVEGMQLSPPLSQLSILRWLNAAGRFRKLAETDVALVARLVKRWNGRLQRQLKAEIPELPEAITAVLKPETPAESAPNETAKEAAASPSAPAPVPEAETADEPEAADAPEETETEAESDETASPREPREERRSRENRKPKPEERPGRASREAAPEKGGRKPFDFKDTLRALEAYVGALRNELEQTRTQLRKRDEGGRRSRNVREEKPPVDVEALQRHNRQLEETVEHLRQQLQDLTNHDEAVAESRRLHSDDPLPEGSADQLRSLLSIRLQESYETYVVMRLDPLDRVFRLDYRDLLGSVFEMLRQEGVELKEPKPDHP